MVSLYETPGYALDLGPVALEGEVVRRLAEGVLGVKETVPDDAILPASAEVEESGDEVCEQKNTFYAFTGMRGYDFKNTFFLYSADDAI